MAFFTTIWRSPMCFNCLRQSAIEDLSTAFYPFHRQVRGKKKIIKRATTINVRLLEDMPGFGRKGSVTPVEPGRMRNYWYPRRKAQYMTASTEPGQKPQKVQAERDFNFGVKQKVEEEVKTPGQEIMRPVTAEVQTKLLSPTRTSEILEATLPSHIIFYRTPIPEPEPPPQEPPSRRRGASSAAAELDLASDPLPKSPRSSTIPIFGSVSTADIVDSIKTILAETEEGARAVIGPEDISLLKREEETFEGEGIEGDRLKALGNCRTEIRVKGGDSVMRTITVKAQETSVKQ